MNQNRPKRFFNEVTKKIGRQTISVVLVTHLLPDRPNFIEALSKISKIEHIIPKPNSIDLKTMNEIVKQRKILTISRSTIDDDKYMKKILSAIKGKFIILDIGGYFAIDNSTLYDLAKKNKLLGIIEDTENGIQRYEKLSHLPCPIYSVARSPLKEPENLYVAESSIFSVESILREENLLINNLNVGLIGLGKIGFHIAKSLHNRGLSFTVYDSDPIKMISASANGYHISKKEDLLRKSDLIFCATGNKAIKGPEYPQVKKGARIACITSSDDELDTRTLHKDYKRSTLSDHSFKYSSATNHFYLLGDGKAINFLHNAVIGNYIYLVQAEILSCIQYFSNSKLESRIYELDNQSKTQLARTWLKHFAGNYD